MMASCSIAAKEAEGENTLGPNWLELPTDITANILQRVGNVEIVTSACQVCPQWWNICKDPLMWRTIRMGMSIIPSHSNYYRHSELRKICRYAVERSCGYLEDIDIQHFGTDKLLKWIAENARNLRCMRLSNCFSLSDKGFIKAVRKLQKLEKLDITLCNLSKDCLEVLGRSCPHLKSLKFLRMWYDYNGSYDDEAFVIAETMSGLRHLIIKGNELSNIGLIAILDGCPLLESLDIRRCYYLELSESLRKRCLEQIKEFREKNLQNHENYYYDGHVSDLDSLSDHDY